MYYREVVNSYCGVRWMILLSFSNSINDMLIRFLNQISPIETTFLRHFFAVIFLIPFVYKSKFFFKTRFSYQYLVRAIILYLAMFLWIKSLSLLPLVVVSTFSLLIPVFTMCFACVILNEKITMQYVIVLLLGILGTLFIIFGTLNTNYSISLFTVKIHLFYLFISTILFAFSDILAKQYTSNNNTIATIFYTTLCVTIISAAPTYYVWLFPTKSELYYCCILGIGSNLTFYFLLRALAVSNLYRLAPFRYLEILFSSAIGFIMYEELLTRTFYLGALIILISNWLSIYCRVATPRLL